jgi:acetylornithine deacetylase/succinyl-diaminopimelate desuccinylase-like protein
VPGFYDGIPPLTDEERRQIAAVPFDEEELMADLGVEALWGEAGYTPRERTWVRPTLEIVGIWGGFQGAGVKTVLPSEAHAKIVCRLAPGQDPDRVAGLIAEQVARVTPAGATAEVKRLPFAAKPYLMPSDHWGNSAARAVLTEMYGREPYFTRTGGSIPVCTLFHEQLGAYTVNFGFGLADERQHSPNEFFRLSSFRRGQEGYCKLLERLGQG